MKPTWQNKKYGVRLYRGDCLEVMPRLPRDVIDAVIADLPYGTTRNQWDTCIPFDQLWSNYESIVARGGGILLTAQQPFTSALIASKKTWFRYEWIWHKSRPTGFLDAKRKPLRDHESVLVFGQTLPRYNPQMRKGKIHARGGRGSQSSNYGKHGFRATKTKSDEYFPRSVLSIPSEGNAASKHPTQKPLALMRYLIQTYADAEQVLLDNTMGSGTTGVAAIETGRQFIGIELDPGYFDIAVDRIKQAIKAKQTKPAAIAA